MKKLPTIIAFVMLSLGAGVLVAHAQGYTPLTMLPGTASSTNPSQTDMISYLSGAIKLLLAIGSSLSILIAIIGGTQYVAAGISPDAKNNAKSRITNAFIGLALMLTSYLILNSINPALVKFSFNLEKLKTLKSLEVSVAPTQPQSANQSIPILAGVSDTTMLIAVKLQEKYPNIVFTSGKRTNYQQARAMATNVVGSGGDGWIYETYGSKSPDCALLLQTYVTNTPHTVANDLVLGFNDILANNPSICSTLSKHLIGEAFDIQPTNPPTYTYEEVKVSINTILTGSSTTEGAGWTSTTAYSGAGNDKSPVYPDEASCKTATDNLLSNDPLYTIIFPCAYYSGAGVNSSLTNVKLSWSTPKEGAVGVWHFQF